MKALKIGALGAVTAAGLATGAMAQQSNDQQQPMSTEQHQQMMGRGNMSNMPDMMGMMNMMNDPNMRQQMTAMMGDCQKMMTQMSGMHGGQKKPAR